MKTVDQNTKTSTPDAPRKPFVAPTLTREAELTEATAERTFTFSMAS